MERQELDSANHRQLVGELAQVRELVSACRRKLSECAPSRTDAGELQIQVAAVQRDDDVDAGLQHIEHLLLALVGRHPDDVIDVNTDCRDDTQHDRLASTADGLRRENRSLRRAIHENEELRHRVERLQSDARRLRGHNVALQVELDRLRAAADDLRAELNEFMPDAGSADMSSVAEALRELNNEARQLQAMNNTLQARVEQLGERSVSKTTKRKTEVEELEAERETLTKRQNEMQLALKLSQKLSETISPVTHDTEDLASEIDKLENQLCLRQDACTQTQLTLLQKLEFSRKIEEEKEQLICKIDELELKAKKKEDEFEVIFDRLDRDNKIIRCQNDALIRKICQLEAVATTDAFTVNDPSVGQENAALGNGIEALNKAICRQSELILQMDEKLRRHHHHHQHSHSSDHEELRMSNASEEVADVLARLKDDSTALEKALAMRDVLCRDVDRAKTHNAKLSRVVAELRAELDEKDSDIVRMGASVAQLEERLAAERREFVDAVQLVRRENAAECDKIAEENRRLATLLKELELITYTGKIGSPIT